MAWFKRSKKSIDQPTPPDERRVKTEGLWTKCTGCRAIVWKKDLEANAHVCAKCQYHFRLNSRQRLELLLDGHWIEHDAQIASNDPLHFSDTRPYAERLKEARRKLGMSDAVLTAEGLLSGRPVICCSMEFAFIGGSMGGGGGGERARVRAGGCGGKSDPGHRALCGAQNAAGDYFLFGRRAHDGGHAQFDAIGQSVGSAGAARRSRGPVFFRAYSSNYRRRHGQLCHAGRPQYRGTRRSDRLRRPARN